MISVCLATYNGQKYILNQLVSIIKNLNEEDEIIISDDGSTDETLNIISRLQGEFSNIKILEGPHKGVKANFENALKHAKGDFIYLSDQDDIWMEKKVKMVQAEFTDGVMLVVHDAIVIDNNMDVINESFFKLRQSKSGVLKNLWKNSYIGCCMAFRKEVLQSVLPIPNNIEMHDQWIGIISDLHGKNIFLPEKLIYYRRHDNNVSGMHHHAISKMICNRINFIVQLLKRGRK